MLFTSAFAACRSRMTKTPTNATRQKTRERSSVVLRPEALLRSRSMAATMRDGCRLRTPDLGSLIRFFRRRFHMEFIAFVGGQQVVDTYHLHRAIEVADAQVSDRPRHVEDKLAHPHRGGQDLWRYQYLSGEQAAQHMSLELAFGHA